MTGQGASPSTPEPEIKPLVLSVRNGRHPIAVLVMVAATLIGGLGLLGVTNPESVLERFLVEPYRTIYYFLLLVSGLITSIAVWLPDIRDRLIWERIGLLPFAGALLVYPIALLALASNIAALGAITVSLFGFAGLWRAIEITHDLHKWRYALKRIKERT